MVVYADRFIPETEKARAQDSGEEARTIPFLKRFTVFNVAQCEGLENKVLPDPAPLPERETIPIAEEVIAASGVLRSEEHTSELQSLMRISYAVFCLKKKK